MVTIVTVARLRIIVSIATISALMIVISGQLWYMFLRTLLWLLRLGSAIRWLLRSRYRRASWSRCRSRLDHNWWSDYNWWSASLLRLIASIIFSGMRTNIGFRSAVIITSRAWTTLFVVKFTVIII